MIGPLRRISAVLAALPMILIGGARADDEGHTDEPLEQVKAKVEAKRAILVDVREQKEWDRGHIEGALLVPLSRLSDWGHDGMTAEEKAALARSLPKGSVVYCHCRAGHRALSGAEILRGLGYDARALKPGYDDLIKAGFPRAPEPGAATGSKSRSK
jgi:rhodanese-related sulfurtransferase